MITIYQHSKGQACIKLYKGCYEISIALDDSCKAEIPTTMFRGDVKIYNKGGMDVTGDFYPDYDENSQIPTDWDVLKDLMDKIELKLKS